MEDSLSVKSAESVANSDEYEFVNVKGNTIKSSHSPLLNIANNGNLEDLENNLQEVILDLINFNFFFYSFFF